jgi:hypothetical protein
MAHGLPQFTVWNAPRGEAWTEEQEKDDAWHRFVLLDTDADGQLTAEASIKGGGGAFRGAAEVLGAGVFSKSISNPAEPQHGEHSKQAGALLSTHACRPPPSARYTCLQELLPAFAELHPTENRYARMVSFRA